MLQSTPIDHTRGISAQCIESVPPVRILMCVYQHHRHFNYSLCLFMYVCVWVAFLTDNFADSLYTCPTVEELYMCTTCSWVHHIFHPCLRRLDVWSTTQDQGSILSIFLIFYNKNIQNLRCQRAAWVRDGLRHLWPLPHIYVKHFQSQKTSSDEPI